MSSITGYTAARMKEIEDSAIVDGEIVGDDLILSRYDATTINAGNVRGPTGPANPDGNPVGTIIMGGWATEPAGYKFLNGQTIVGGTAAHPDLASQYPNWVDGADLVLPDGLGAVPKGESGAFGLVSGSMQHTLTTPNLPAHTHTGPPHTHAGPSHIHSINSHGHTATSGTTGDHDHQLTDMIGVSRSYLFRMGAYVGGGNYFTVYDGGGGTLHQFGWNTVPNSNGVAEDGDHNHSINVNGSGTLATNASGTDQTSSAGTGNTGSTGSGSPVDHTPRNIGVRFAVKTD